MFHCITDQPTQQRKYFQSLFQHKSHPLIKNSIYESITAMLKVQAPTYSLIKLKHLHHQYSRSSNTGQSATSPSSQIFLPREVRLQQQQYRLVELKAEVAACGDTSPQHARLHIFLTGNSRRHNGGRHFSK